MEDEKKYLQVDETYKSKIIGLAFICSVPLIVFIVVPILMLSENRLFSEIKDLPLYFFCGILSVFLIVQIYKTWKKGQRYSKYVFDVVNLNITSIDEISTKHGESYNKTILDLQFLIRKGYLKKYYIDLNTKEIINKEPIIRENSVDTAIQSQILNNSKTQAQKVRKINHQEERRYLQIRSKYDGISAFLYLAGFSVLFTIVMVIISIYDAGTMQDKSYDVFVAFICTIASLIAIMLGYGVKKVGVRYSKYYYDIVNLNMYSINEIALKHGETYNAVLIDLQNLIKTGDLSKYYIDQNTKEILYKETNYKSNTINPAIDIPKINTPLTNNQKQKDPKTPPTRTVIAECKSCGANNVVVVGQLTYCEYCENPIII